MPRDDHFLAYSGIMEAPLADSQASGSSFIPYFSSVDNKFYRADKRAMNSLDKTTIVTSASQLSGELDPSVTYFIDGDIDMGDTPITVPQGGLVLYSDDPDNKGLYSTAENYTMFVNPSEGYAGRVRMRLMHLQCSGSGSKLFDLDNQDNSNSFEFVSVNFGGFIASRKVTEIGSLTDYRQVFFDGCGFYNVQEGITLNGSFGGLVLQNSNFINSIVNLGTMLARGVGLTFSGSVRSNANFIAVNSGAVFADFQDSNFLEKGGFSLSNFRTAATNPLPNITGASSYARFRNNEGIKNTYVGGQWAISVQAVTTLSTISVPAKVAGTTVYSDLQWFTQSTSNAFVYDGDQTIEVEIKGNLSFSGTNGDVINLYVRHWDASASSYIDLSETAGSTLNSAGR